MDRLLHKVRPRKAVVARDVLAAEAEL
jgi:hypothetical protein